ncbi:hypothetical protein AB0C00_04240, partial [Micromonospora carbonacea]
SATGASAQLFAGTVDPPPTSSGDKELFNGRLLASLTGAGLSFLGYALLALLPGSRLGFGDVKLAAVLGLPLGWLGWPALLTGLVLPHVLHGLAVLGLLAARRIRRDTLLPLGPALLAGAWLATLAA